MDASEGLVQCARVSDLHDHRPFAIAELSAAASPLLKVILGDDGRPRAAHAGVIVAATPARVWSVVSDVGSYSRRVPMIDSVSRAGDLVTMDLKFKISFFSAGFKVRMNADIDEGRSLLLRYKDGEPRDIDIRFDLEAASGKTALFAYVGYDILSLGWVSKWFLKHHPEIRFGIIPGSALALVQMLREAAES